MRNMLKQKRMFTVHGVVKLYATIQIFSTKILVIIVSLCLTCVPKFRFYDINSNYIVNRSLSNKRSMVVHKCRYMAA